MRTVHQPTAIKAILDMVLEQEAYKVQGSVWGASRTARLISEAFDRFSYLHDALVEGDLEWADSIWDGILEILERALKKGYEVELDTIKLISRM